MAVLALFIFSISWYKSKFYILIRLVYKLSCDTNILMVILKFVFLKGLYCQDVNLQLCKSSSNAHPGSMREHNRGVGVSAVLLRAASEPSFRKEILRGRELRGILASYHDTVTGKKDNFNFK